jgi:hypothetical protein
MQECELYNLDTVKCTMLDHARIKDVTDKMKLDYAKVDFR